MIRSVVIEADGGSRGNPGPAAYGAVLMDADTGEVLAEDARTLGVATNNVAEYSGLVAGLELAAELAPNAEVAVRMDSKLVVEQMSGRWKIKHPDLRPLAMRAHALAPFGTTYTWIPREQNKHADRLANEALDGQRDGVTVATSEPPTEEPVGRVAGPAGRKSIGEPAAPVTRETAGYRGWAHPGGTPTTLLLVRHGVTAHTTQKRFSGGLGSVNPGLSEEGREQIRAAAEWLAPLAGQLTALVASPVRRTRESAEILAERLGLPVVEDAGLAEMEFGDWDGLTFGEIAERYPADLEAWLGSVETPSGGGTGESFRQVEQRVLAALDRVLAAHPGGTVLVVSHVTPIKTLVARALLAPLSAVFRMELAPASVSVVSWYPPAVEEAAPTDEPMASLRLYNARPTDEAFGPSLR